VTEHHSQDDILVRPTLKTIVSKAWGWMLIINTLIFLAMVYEAGTLGVPSGAVLLDFGAKDPVLIAQGQWWRLISSMFIHIGVLHYFMNSYAIYVIGPQVEEMIGTKAFLLIYMVAGIFGAACSNIFSVVLSAGASGAILGLLGVGLFVETSFRRKIKRTTGQKPRAGAYLINTIGILILGTLIPNIDNAAHIGGLVSGYAAAFVLFNLVPNRLRPVNLITGYFTGFICLLLFAGSIGVATNRDFAIWRMTFAAENTDEPAEKYYLLGRAIDIAPDVIDIRLSRIQLALDVGDRRAAIPDIRDLSRQGQEERLRSLAQELRENGREVDAAFILYALSTDGMEEKFESNLE
jgi:membrane associated rhomboid family serine protease